LHHGLHPATSADNASIEEVQRRQVADVVGTFENPYCYGSHGTQAVATLDLGELGAVRRLSLITPIDPYEVAVKHEYQTVDSR